MVRRFLFLIVGILIGANAMRAQEPLDRTIRPAGQPLPKIDLPDIQKTTLANGLQVWLVESHSLPLVALNLVIRSGEDSDPHGKPGIASMTADMLDEGTQTRDALQISDELEFIGANLRVRSTTDATFISLNTLSRHLEKALDVYTDVIAHAVFPQNEFDRLKEQRLTSLLQQKDRPSTIASNAFQRIVYGPDHPYGTNPDGTEESISALSRADLVAFYQAYYRPNNAVLLVVGDITMKSLTSRLQSGLSDWHQAPVPDVAIPEPSPLGTRKVYLIDKPGAAQSEIRIGYAAAARNSPDYFALLVMNRALGGQFSSRLNLNLREKHGYTYGARSNFIFFRYTGPFIASSAVVTAKTDSSIREFINEITLMHEEGLTQQELEFVKKGLTGNFILNFETPAQIAGALQNVVLYDLPDDYYETYLQNIQQISLEDVKNVSSKYLDSSKMAIVAVGDLGVVRKGVENLGYGDVELCDVEGQSLIK